MIDHDDFWADPPPGIWSVDLEPDTADDADGCDVLFLDLMIFAAVVMAIALALG